MAWAGPPVGFGSAWPGAAPGHTAGTEVHVLMPFQKGWDLTWSEEQLADSLQLLVSL